MEVSEYPGITCQIKEELIEKLQELKELSEKEEVDAGTLQKLSNWMKENAPWVVPILQPVINGLAQLAFG